MWVCVMLHGDVVMCCCVWCCVVMLFCVVLWCCVWWCVRCCVWWCEWCGGCWLCEMIDFMLFWGFAFRQTNGRTNERMDIGGCRVTFATENTTIYHVEILPYESLANQPIFGQGTPKSKMFVSVLWPPLVILPESETNDLLVSMTWLIFTKLYKTKLLWPIKWDKQKYRQGQLSKMRSFSEYKTRKQFLLFPNISL